MSSASIASGSARFVATDTTGASRASSSPRGSFGLAQLKERFGTVESLVGGFIDFGMRTGSFDARNA